MITYYSTEVEQQNGDRLFLEIDSEWEDLVSFGMGIIRKDSEDGYPLNKDMSVHGFEGTDNVDFYHFALTGEKPDWMGTPRVSVLPEGDEFVEFMAEMDFERNDSTTKIIMSRYEKGEEKASGTVYEYEMPTEEFTEIAKQMYELHLSCVAYREEKIAADKEFDPAE